MATSLWLINKLGIQVHITLTSPLLKEQGCFCAAPHLQRTWTTFGSCLVGVGCVVYHKMKIDPRAFQPETIVRRSSSYQCPHLRFLARGKRRICPHITSQAFFKSTRSIFIHALGPFTASTSMPVIHSLPERFRKGRGVIGMLDSVPRFAWLRRVAKCWIEGGTYGFWKVADGRGLWYQ